MKIVVERTKEIQASTPNQEDAEDVINTVATRRAAGEHGEPSGQTQRDLKHIAEVAA